MRIAGIDPGLRSGALVVVQSRPERVLASASLVEEGGAAREAKRRVTEIAEALGGWSDKEFASACLRADEWMRRFRQAFEAAEKEHGEIDYVACESFVDQPSRASQEKAGLLRKRWQTPLLTGYLNVYLAERGYTIENGRLVFQSAGVVIKQLAEELGVLKRGRPSARERVISGASLVRNDHERKALAHAMALRLRLARYGDPAQKRSQV